MKFAPGKVEEWMDCGNKNVTVETNRRMLGFLEKDGEKLVSDTVTLENAQIIEPCFIGEHVILKNTEILAREVLTLPCYPELNQESIQVVVNAVNSWAP